MLAAVVRALSSVVKESLLIRKLVYAIIYGAESPPTKAPCELDNTLLEIRSYSRGVEMTNLSSESFACLRKM